MKERIWKKHIREIKVRGIYTMVSMLLTFMSAYIYSESLIYILAEPLASVASHKAQIAARNEGFHLIFTELTEALWTYIHVSMYIALYMGTIIGIYQGWEFIKPGLYEYEKKKIRRTMMAGLLLSIASASITYWIVLPSTCKFFLSFEISKPIQIHLEAKMSAYCQMVAHICALCQVIFQCPTVIYICVRVGLVSQKRLIALNSRRAFIFFSFLTSGLLAPPGLTEDIVAQSAIAISMAVLYEIGVYMALFEENLASGAKRIGGKN